MPNQNRRRPGPDVRRMTREIGGGSYNDIRTTKGKAEADRIQAEALRRLRNR
ncbi:hypothetical protein N9M39_00300 [Halieaceae bacterium]|nr:hypothetical protein [Halieaceae bacterium]